MQVHLHDLASLRRAGTPKGITSVCSAHPVVLRAALRYAGETGSTALIEATCNQVNHQGGYTGMRPADFASLVGRLAREEDCPERLLILGGDHLGPNPWRELPAAEAMAEAETMIAAYATAGFRKMHIDASMGCRGEPVALDDETTARRAAQLVAVAEAAVHRAGGEKITYVIGTEVPAPGGADHSLAGVRPTSPAAARETIRIHRRIFADAGLSDAFSRAVALVVQPGVEFGSRNVVVYDPAQATELTRVLDDEPQFVFEAHSTDYQGAGPLGELVADGFAILKVGPELTFVLREALYALDLIASDLVSDYGQRPLHAAMESLMVSRQEHWSRHYTGSQSEMRWLRHYSLSDRIRYYWASAPAQAAVDRLLASLKGESVPLPLFWQHMPAAAHFADSPLDPEALLVWRVTRSLAAYHAAGCGERKNRAEPMLLQGGN